MDFSAQVKTVSVDVPEAALKLAEAVGSNRAQLVSRSTKDNRATIDFT